MIPDRIKNRLAKDRTMTSITLRIPVDVVESMKEIAPQRGFSGYQALLKSYGSWGHLCERQGQQIVFIGIVWRLHTVRPMSLNSMNDLDLTNPWEEEAPH